MGSSRRRFALVLTIVSALTLTACSADAVTSEAEPTASRLSTPSATPSETIKAPPRPQYTAEELEAVRVAGYASMDSLDTLYSICADTDGMYQTRGPMNDGQRAEARGALVLCPDHPAAAIMGADSPVLTPEEQQRADGLRFSDGLHAVGVRIQAGTFRTVGEVHGCYWARLDSSGRTIANDFIPAAPQVEVTVEASDFSLHTDGCGDFVRVG